MAYNRRRWGSDGWARSLPGRREGQKFVNWRIWPNTVLSARLIHLAGERGGWQLQHRAKGIIFRMIYEDGLNVSDRAVVEAAGRELGLEGVEELLRSDEGQREVLKEAREASRMGISGVPFFVCSREGDAADPVTFSGAQPVKTFVQTIRKLAGS